MTHCACGTACEQKPICNLSRHQRRLRFVPHAPYRVQLEPWRTLVEECGPQPLTVVLAGCTIGTGEMGD